MFDDQRESAADEGATESMDLSCIESHDPTREDRVIGAVMARVRDLEASGAKRSTLAQVAEWWRPVAAIAAAVVIVLAGAMANRTHAARTATTATSREATEREIFEWVATGHVPTNAELVSTFYVRER
jgi:hypothetical protein